jgi:hypothetical protein
MKEAVMTDRRFRDNEYVRRGEALGGTAWGWILGIGTAALIGFLVIANYSVGDNTASTANNSAPNATSNSPPRIPPSTTGSGAQPEQPAQTRPGGWNQDIILWAIPFIEWWPFFFYFLTDPWCSPMTRYKGQHRTARVEVEFPHHVDIIVPPGGSRGSMRCTPLTPSTASSHSLVAASTIPMAQSFAGVLPMQKRPKLSLQILG